MTDRASCLYGKVVATHDRFMWGADRVVQGAQSGFEQIRILLSLLPGTSSPVIELTFVVDPE
jgi:hypothetical protein